MKNLVNQKGLLFCILGVIGYLFIFTIYTFPFITHLSTHTIGSGDANIFYFNAHNFAFQIEQGKSVFWTDLLFQPDGSSLIMHTHTTSLSFFAWLTGNTVLGMNLFIIINYLLSGLGGLLLSKKFIKNYGYCFIIGVLFAFSSYKMSRLEEHHNLILTGFVPFVLLFYFKFRNRYSLSSGLGLISCLIITLFSDYILTITCLLFVSIHLIWSIIHAPVIRLLKKHPWKSIGGISVIIIVLHNVTVALRAIHINDNSGLWWSGDLSSFFVPFHNLIFSGWSVIPWHKEVIGGQYGLESTMFLGYTLIVLLIVSVLFRKKSTNFSEKQKPFAVSYSSLLLPLIILFLLALPQIKLLNYRLLYSPTAIFHFIPLINNHRCPTRIIHLIYLLLGIITFYNLENGKLANHLKKPIVTGLIGLLIFIEGVPLPFEFQNRSTSSPLYSELKNKPFGNALILPLGIVDGYEPIGEFDINQLGNIPYHHKATFGGHLSRINEALKEKQLTSTFLKQVIQLELGELSEKECVIVQDQFLPQVDYVVIPSSYISSDVTQYLVRQFETKISEKRTFSTGELWIISNEVVR